MRKDANKHNLQHACKLSEGMHCNKDSVAFPDDRHNKAAVEWAEKAVGTDEWQEMHYLSTGAITVVLIQPAD